LFFHPNIAQEVASIVHSKVVGSIFENHLFAIIGYFAWSIISANQSQHIHFETLQIKNVISLVFLTVLRVILNR
jgi:hypothetical protein